MLKNKEDLTYWATTTQHPDATLGSVHPIVLAANHEESCAESGDFVLGISNEYEITVYEIIQTGHWLENPYADPECADDLLWLMPTIAKIVSIHPCRDDKFVPENAYTDHLLYVCRKIFAQQAYEEMACKTPMCGAALRLTDSLGSLFITAFRQADTYQSAELKSSKRA